MDRKIIEQEITGANSTFAIGGVSCSADSLVVAESFVLRIKFSGKNPAHRKSANRYQQGEADTQQKSCKLPTHRQSQKFATHLLLADPQKKNRMKMDYITYSERLDYLLDLIKNEKLFSPREVADKFDCSEKTVRNMINCLREKGFEIDYCKCSRKYFLKN